MSTDTKVPFPPGSNPLYSSPVSQVKGEGTFKVGKEWRGR